MNTYLEKLGVSNLKETYYRKICEFQLTLQSDYNVSEELVWLPCFNQSIVDIFMSSCSRFQVNPIEDYGFTETKYFLKEIDFLCETYGGEVLHTLASINTPEDWLSLIRKARNIITENTVIEKREYLNSNEPSRLVKSGFFVKFMQIWNNSLLIMRRECITNEYSMGFSRARNRW